MGATTRAGMLSAPLRDRFGIISHMGIIKAGFKEIVLRSADIFQTEILRKVPLKLRAAQEEPPNC